MCLSEIACHGATDTMFQKRSLGGGGRMGRPEAPRHQELNSQSNQTNVLLCLYLSAWCSTLIG